MVDTYVTKAQLENNKIALTVQADDFKPGEAVEISGQATQNNAALATFDEIKTIQKRARPRFQRAIRT